MDTLSSYANKVNSVILSVQGATTPQVERVNGLPQINVTYDRLRLANYKLIRRRCKWYCKHSICR